MSDNVASLGFEVNSKPLDDAKTKLGEVAAEAGKTGKAVDDFNQKVGKTSGEAAKASDGIGKIGPSMQALESAAKRAGVSVEEMRARTAAFNAESARLAASGRAAGTAIGAIAKEASSVAPALNALGVASAMVAKEHEEHSSALGNLRGNLRGLSPLLSQFGGGLGDVLQYSRAARLGLEGFALVAGGAALVALAKVGDEVERSKNRFAGLTGSAEGGAKAYDAVRAAAKSSGVEFSALDSAVEKAKIGMDKFADRHVIYANTAERSVKQIKELANALGTVGSMMQGNLANAEEENKVLNVLGKTFQETGTLTVDAFRAIQNESPSTALAIANAFGFKTVEEFVKELDKASITIDQFIRRMALVNPAVVAAFDPTTPKTFEQAIKAIGIEWDDFLKKLSKAGAGDIVLAEMQKLKKFAESVPEAIKEVTDALDGNKVGAKSWSELWGKAFKLSGDDVGIWGEKVEVDLAGVLALTTKAGGEIENLFAKSPNDRVSGAFDKIEKSLSSADRAASTFATGVPSGLMAVGQSAVSMAETTASALSRVVSSFLSSLQQMRSAAGQSTGGGGAGGGSGGGDIVAAPADYSGSSSGAGSSYSGSSSGAGSSSEGFATAAMDYGGGSSDYGYFASGGQFTVAGSGGTDSQTVAFMATPGEVVTVSTPDQVQGMTSIQGDPLSAVAQTAAQNATVKEITDSISESTIDISKKVLEGSKNIVTTLNKLIGGVASSTVNPATGLPVSGSSASSLLSSSLGPIKRGGGGISFPQGGEGSHKKPDNEKPDAGDYGGSSFGGLAQPVRNSGAHVSGSFPFRLPINPQSTVPVNPDYGGYSYSRLDPNLFDYLNSEYGSGSTFSDTGTTQYGSNDPYSGNSNYYSPYGGSTDTGIFGADTGAINYGGGSSDMGYFATGGKFTVGGDGGLDTTPVFFHATKGETVEITPSGVTPSILPSPAASSDPSQSNATSTMTKNVVINVQAGIQADSFIRSRAQIARGI